jgi:hypothetical protein
MAARYIAGAMGDDTGDPRPGDTGDTPGRRDFLRKAAVAGTAAFAVPVIITVDPAGAQALTSPPPEPPGHSGPVTPAPGGVSSGAGTPGGDPGARARPTHTELPRSGSDLDRLLAAGLAATAGGAALVLWSADRKAKTRTVDAPEPADPDAT